MDKIKIELDKDNLHVKILADDRQYLEDLKGFFSYPAPGYQFMPRYLNTAWDGKICVLKGRNVLPYGLFLDYVKWHKRKYKSIQLDVDDNVKGLFSGKKFKPKYDLSLYPRPYQEDCIETILNHTKCIVKVATASGKSLIISYVIKTLMERKKNKQYLVVVPTTNLVEQFYGDMIEYGLDGSIIGRVYADIPDVEMESNKPIVISTWQSLANNHDWLDRFYAVIVDECHISGKGVEIKKIVYKAKNAVYRFGVTGTLPDSRLEISNVKSYLGPVVRNYSAKELADDGYISSVHILANYIQYQQQFEGDYFEVREKVFSNPGRMKFIKDTVNDIDDNILILVSLVEKEGKPLTEYLAKHLPDREVTFIHGDTDVKEREEHRQNFGVQKNKVIIATWGIYKMGVNIPSLKYLMFASPLKSKISILQSVGRVLRLFINKLSGAYVIDLIDQVPYLYGHGESRLKYYEKEKFDIESKIICLPSGLDMIL